MPWYSGIAVDHRPLRRRDVRLLWCARGISSFGSMITYVAVPYQVFAITGSTLAVGAVGLAELVAILSLAFLGGALADARDRRRMLLSTEAALGVCAAVLAWNAGTSDPQLAVVFVVAAVMAGLDALQRPALEALIPQLAPTEEMSAVSALFSVQMTAAMVVAPALAGVIIAVTSAAWAFATDAATFAISLVLVRLIRTVPRGDNVDRPSWRSVVEGLRYARSRPDLIGTYVVDMIAMVFGMPMALFPAVADRIGGPRTLGLLYAAPAVGMFFASVSSGWTARVRRHGAAIACAAVVWGAGIIVFGATTVLPIALTGLVIAGAADMVSGLFRMTMWNQTIPERLRGRLASIEMLSYTSGPALGNAEAGLAAGIFGVPVAIVSGGVLCILGVVGATAALPDFWHYRAAVVPEPEPAATST